MNKSSSLIRTAQVPFVKGILVPLVSPACSFLRGLLPWGPRALAALAGAVLAPTCVPETALFSALPAGSGCPDATGHPLLHTAVLRHCRTGIKG